MKSDLNPVDQYVGNRLREMRERMQHTRDMLATAMGTTVEQIERYEHGLERVGAERLYKLARAFSVSATYFFKQCESRPSVEGERSIEQRNPIFGSNNVFDLRSLDEAEHSSYLRSQRSGSKNGVSG